MTEWFVEGFNNPDAEPILFPLPSPAPSAIAMALVTAAAMGLVAAAIPHAGGTRLSGVAAGYVGGLATTMWATHRTPSGSTGPRRFGYGLAIYLAARSNLLWVWPCLRRGGDNTSSSGGRRGSCGSLPERLPSKLAASGLDRRRLCSGSRRPGFVQLVALGRPHGQWRLWRGEAACFGLRR